jgi:HD superfamily phosphohydrolase
MELGDGCNRIIDVAKYSGWKGQLERVKRISANFGDVSSGSEPSYANSQLTRELREKILGGGINGELKGSSHERMSAYLLLSDRALNEIVKNLILAYWNKIGCNAQKNDGDLEDALLFICRMIVGQEYSCYYTTEFDLENYENSMRNCVIRVISGVLDADSMDYIMRNSYSAGYATHKVDYARLCASFSTTENQNVLEPCFSKSSLSVIEGFIVARNFEPKWLYSHHKVVYYDVLIKSIYHYAAKYLCYMDYLTHKAKFDADPEENNEHSNTLECETTPVGAYVDGLLSGQARSPVSNTREPLMSLWPYPYYTYILSPCNVFGAFSGEYDFSNKYCSCKIYKARFKDFRELKIKFGDTAYRIGDVIDVPREKPLDFPYIFYSADAEFDLNSDAENVRRNFIKNFTKYCAGRFSCEQSKKGGGGMNKSFDGQHVIRDVVHGDISFTDQYLDVVNAKEFQRLRRIKQLATASQVFPNATHTRFAHSIGTYHIMKKIISHFQQIFSELNINGADMDDAPIALLAALLHDIGHGPFSHAFEAVAKHAVRHEAWTERIILDENSDVHQRIVRNFGEGMPQKVVDCINHVFQEKKRHLNFSMIYSCLVSGPLDADRMDYLLRDAYNTAARYGSIDVQNIIASMRIAQIDGTYCVCFDESYLSNIEQLIFARYEMYDTVYFANYKVLTETLVQCILQKAYQKRDLLQNEAKIFLETVFNANMATIDFLALDDHAVSHYFQQWENEKRDSALSEMCRSLIDRTGYRAVHVADDLDLNFIQLLEAIENICGFTEGELSKGASSRDICGLIRETRFTNAYPDERLPNDISKSIFIMKRNGLVSDFRNETRLHSKKENHFWRIHKSYLYYNPTVLSLELKARGERPEDIDAKIEKTELTIDSFMPRNHIEIEEKYRCSKETLQAVEDYLVHSGSVSQFALRNSFEATLQEDTYYDTPERLLDAKKCSLRVRKINNAYTCTVKLPVDGENFGGNSQFARFEYETTSSSSELSGFAGFVNAHLRLKGSPIINEAITSGNINSLLAPIITIINNRKKAVVGREKDGDNFMCEVCLDDVTYKAGSIQKKDWQVEIELKSDYLHHIVLKIFTNELEGHFVNSLQREEQSKYVRGLTLLSNLQARFRGKKQENCKRL